METVMLVRDNNKSKCASMKNVDAHFFNMQKEAASHGLSVNRPFFDTFVPRYFKRTVTTCQTLQGASAVTSQEVVVTVDSLHNYCLIVNTCIKNCIKRKIKLDC
jgi:hypothetical protein